MQFPKFVPLAFLLVLCLIGTALASTTEYELVTPDENLSLEYNPNNYYKLGDLKVTAGESFDTGYKVVVTINRESAFANQSADNSSLAYDLVISPDNMTIASGDSFDFLAASIDAQEGLEIGMRVTEDFLTAADGFYMDSLMFKASLDNAAVLPTVGSTMTFGTYNSAAISWRVLSVDVDNNRALLITEQALLTKAYNDTDTSITWEGCTLRAWLNNEFITSNFTTDEQDKIVEVTNTNPNNGSVSGGNDTSDKMFLLSIDEANSYFIDGDDRKCTLLSNNSNISWWLRSPGRDDRCAAIVYVDGSVSADGSIAFPGGVRTTATVFAPLSG